MSSVEFCSPHPLAQLNVSECNLARDLILLEHGSSLIDFRTIALEEPAKALLQPYLDAESSSSLGSATSKPPRLARVAYDTVSKGKVFDFYESVVDLMTCTVLQNELIDRAHHSPLTP